MSKPLHTKATRLPPKLPRLEPAFAEALEAIAKTERWTTAELIDQIRREPGTSLAAKARLFALDYYRGNTLPRGFAETASDPFKAALQHVRNHKPAGRKR